MRIVSPVKTVSQSTLLDDSMILKSFVPLQFSTKMKPFLHHCSIWDLLGEDNCNSLRVLTESIVTIPQGDLADWTRTI